MNYINMPSELMVESEEEIIEWIYGNGALRVENADDIKECAILTPLNEASLEINHKVSELFSHKSFALIEY